MNASVYILKAGELCKIGFTCHLDNRIGAIKRSSQDDLETIRIFQVEDARGLEKDLHSMFEKSRISGEWFRLDQEDIDYLRSIDTPIGYD